MMDFSIIISITLNSKKYDEAIALEKELLEDIGKECEPKYKIKNYLHAKTFDTKYSIPSAAKDLIDKLNNKKCVYITPRITDMDLILHLLAYIKRWRSRADEAKYGRSISVVVDSKNFGDGLFLVKNKYQPSLTRQSFGKISSEFMKQLDDFNKAIDEVPVYIKKEGDEEPVEFKPKKDPVVEQFLRDFPIK